MSEVDPSAEMPASDGSDLGVTELPTGTVTLLLADVEGSTRLWQSQPEEMTAVVALLDRTLAEAVTAHGGVRPVEQGEGDSFVVAFTRASDAVACALDLQRAPLAPIRLRIGIHTGEVQLRDEGNYVGPTINRTARLRDLAHGGQTVLSGATEDMIVDWLPDDAWLTDLGTHPLRDLPRPERVVQLCHPGLRNEFPPLRTADSGAIHNLPVQLTSFVGRRAEMASLREILADSRLVTLTGVGGAGKTRLAVQITAQLADRFDDGACYVDLAPLTHPDLVRVAVASALSLPDQPGRSTLDTLLRFLRDRRMLMVLDNCEHLLDASAELAIAVLSACPSVTVLATSREPIRAPGEVTWQVPSLSLADEAVELFADRARHVRPDFHVAEANAAEVAEICRRLDGLPLAIELAAAWVRTLSVAEIRDGLHDRFRLLTGGSRTAVRRQQTLRASVDWSHALLSEPEQVLLRRLAVFLGGFDLDAAEAVCGDREVVRYQVLDQLGVLIDKSLVVAETMTGQTRYRMLETVRQYAAEKLGESGEAGTVRSRHRDYYTSMAASLDASGRADYERRLEQAEIEIDNLRAAFGWSLDNADTEAALALTSSLQPLWQSRGRIREGLAWFDAGLADEAGEAEPARLVRARALVDRAMLAIWAAVTESMDEARQALLIAREVGDSALVARALSACALSAAIDVEGARTYFAESIGLARELNDQWRLCQILGWQALGALAVGDISAAGAAAEEGRDLADAIGDRLVSRQCRYCLGLAQLQYGDLAGAAALFRQVADEAEAAHDLLFQVHGLGGIGIALAWLGDPAGALAAARAAIEAAAELGGFAEGFGHTALGAAALAAGNAATAQAAYAAAWQYYRVQPVNAAVMCAFNAHAALSGGDVAEARRWADDGVATAPGAHLVMALATRARVAITQGEPDRADADAREGLARAAELQAHLVVPDLLECLAAVAGETGRQPEAARVFGAAQAIRQRHGTARFAHIESAYQDSVAALRNAMGDAAFDAAWAEGAALATEEAIDYARRGRGERRRASSGWASLTAAELDVVRLVSAGLANSEIAARLFISPRTVQTHLTHIYTKLGLTSRVQLAQEATRRT